VKKTKGKKGKVTEYFHLLKSPNSIHLQKALATRGLFGGYASIQQSTSHPATADQNGKANQNLNSKKLF
jgi:hypothetical protein